METSEADSHFFSGFIFIPIGQLLITWSSSQLSNSLTLSKGGETMLTFFFRRVSYTVNLSAR